MSRQGRSSTVQWWLHHSQATFRRTEGPTQELIFTNICSTLHLPPRSNPLFLILEPKGLDRFGKIDELGFVLAKLCSVVYFPSNVSYTSKARTDLPRFPHLISNRKLIVRFYFLVCFLFYLEFYIAPLFFFIQQVDSLDKKVSFHVLFWCSKNSSPFDQSFANFAPPAALAPFYTCVWLTIYIYAGFKDMNVCLCDSRFSFNKPFFSGF